MKGYLFLYRPAFASTVVYMLQSVEYRAIPYLKWLWRTNDFNNVIYRKELVTTKPAKMLLLAFRLSFWAIVLIGLLLIVQGLAGHSYLEAGYGVVLLFISPILTAHLITLPLLLGDWLVIKPSQRARIEQSNEIFAKHPAQTIAIAGSYGKTTVKEILLTVLSEGKKVKATPANKNVSISHAQFAKALTGDEDILIIEYGEGKPGDVMKFAKKTHPNAGIITGLAPAHLDKYRTLTAAAQDIFSLAHYLKDQNVYVNGDSKESQPYVKKDYIVFSNSGIGSWKVKNVKIDINGLSFILSNKNRTIKVKSQLLGEHLIGPLALAVYLGDKYGLTNKQIEAGIAKITSFEHRMQPYKLSDAWIIDDTYNGNIEGMKAGLALLKKLKARRKVYVTPGLVDQGEDEEKIHQELGVAIKQANPDKVVLMKHSVTDYIVKGLKGYEGEVVIEDDPLDFYTNLDKFVAAGDLVLMQNDWPDNYN
jgi:UDP-N-acetylmuramoyl-tripeptide--D-alanyl-D-alanine ligase